MISNLNKFHIIMLYKQKRDHINEHLSVKIQEIKENKAV